jgi:FMN-dependent NADH-azoreductase
MEEPATMKLLHIDASATHSPNRQLSAALVENLAQANPALEIVYRDLEARPLPQPDGRTIATRQNDAVLREFLDADVIVVGAPTHSVAIPGRLKAWIDHILVAGVTFRYTETGAEGLAGGKTVIIVAAQGGRETPGGAHAASQEPHLKALFQFMGIEDVTVVRGEREALDRPALNSRRPRRRGARPPAGFERASPWRATDARRRARG